jgi:hypothetical protein
MQTFFGLVVATIFTVYIYLRIFGYGSKKKKD